MMGVEISLLGQFGIKIDGRPLALPSKAIELIAYLALQPKRRASVDQLLEVLWPDFPPARALGNLNTTLWRMRRVHRQAGVLSVVVRTHGGVAIDPAGVHADIWRFEECVEIHNSSTLSASCAAEAVELFKGDLLEGDFDIEWLAVERERVRQLYLRALRTHAHHQAINGKLSEALRDYQLAIERDPLNEDLAREIMRVYYTNGKRREALLVFSTLSKRLRFDLQVEPEPETIRLSEVIRSQRPLEPSGGERIVGSWSEVEMVGRDSSMLELNEALNRALAGTSMCIGVEGEMGVGKTRLVTEFSRQAELKGCKVVFWSNSEESPSAQPYSSLEGILANSQDVSGVTERSFDESGFAIAAIVNDESQGETPPESPSQRHFRRVFSSWLKDHRGSNPLVIVVDDAQYSDLPSLRLILETTRQLRSEKVLVILTWRGEDCSDRVTKLFRSQRDLLKTMRLSRLDLREVSLICHMFLSPTLPPESLVDSIYNESEGNPLFVLEHLKSLACPERNSNFARRRHVHPIGYRSETIRGRVLTRVERLSPSAKRVARVASAIGRRIHPHLIARILRLSIGTILGRLEVLRKVGLVEIKEDGFEFVHDKIRAICYEDTSIRDRARIHQQILAALEQAFPDRLDALAYHSHRAGSSRSVSYWERLGDRAAGLWAHSEACEAYTMALGELAIHGRSPGGSHQFKLLKKRLLTWECLGDLAKAEIDARTMYELAKESGEELKSCETFIVDSRLLLRQGHFNRALDRAHLAIEIARRLSEASLEAEAREVASLSMLRLHEYSRAEAELKQVVRILERLRDVRGLERAWTSLSRLYVVQGHHAKTIESLMTAERYSTGDLSEESTRAVIRGVARGFLGRGRDALADLRAASSGFQKVGNRSGRAVANSWLAHFNLCDGRVSDAVTCARKALPFIAARSEVRWGLISASVLSYGFWSVLGNLKRAEREIARSWKDVETKGNPGHFLDTAAGIALEQNDAERALAIAERAMEHFSGREEAGLSDCLTTLGRIYLAMARPRDAAGALQRAANLQESTNELLMLPRSLSFLAIAQMRMGLINAALETSQRAMDLLSQNDGFAHMIQDIYWNRFLVLREAGDPGSLTVLERAADLVSRRASQLGKKGRSRFLSISVNREIVETLQKVVGKGIGLRPDATSDARGRKVTVSIPVAGATFGRPLRQNEHVEVIWTVDAGKPDQALRDSKGELGLRRARILRLCAEADVQGGDPREEDLARVLGVTTRTIRSDIAHLRAQGCHVHTRGTRLR